MHVARWKYRTQKLRQKSPYVHHRTTLSGHIFATEACIDNRKNLLDSISPTCSHNGELRLTSGWDRFVSLGHPSEFQRILRIGFITAATSLNGSQPNFARCLAVYWVGRLYIHFSGTLAPLRNFAKCKIDFASTSCSLALSYIGSVTARHSSSGRQPNCGAEQRAPPIFTRAAIRSGIGPHSSSLFFRLLYSPHLSFSLVLISRKTKKVRAKVVSVKERSSFSLTYTIPN